MLQLRPALHWRVEPVTLRVNGAARPAVSYVCLDLTCGCPGSRRPPLRLMPEALFWLRAALGGRHPPAELVVQTYRCSDCGTVVEITAGDLLLAPIAEPMAP